MNFLLLPRKGDPNVAAGWGGEVGSVNERPGVTGVAHLFEHMMFKGTHTIGAKDIEKDLATIRKLDDLRKRIQAEETALIEKHRRGGDRRSQESATQKRGPRGAHRGIREVDSATAGIDRQGRVRPDLYAAGASGMNAGTTNDFTIYFINVPANKLELWVLDGVRPVGEPGFPRVLFRAGRSTRRAPVCGSIPRPRASSTSSSTRCFGSRRRTTGRHWLAQRLGGHHARGSPAVFFRSTMLRT